MKSGKPIGKGIVIILVLILLIGTGIFINFYFSQGKGSSDFELDTLSLKMVVSGNETVNKTIRVQNTRTSTKHFSVSVTGVGDFIDLPVSSFDLSPDEKYFLGFIVDANNTDEGIYLGKLEISSENGKKEVLIIFFYLVVLVESNVQLNYFIKDFNWKTILFETEDLIIDDKLTFTKSFQLPKDVALGDYALGVVLDYSSYVGTSSTSFKVAKSSFSFDFDSVDLGSFPLLFGIGLIFLLIMGLFLYSTFSRDRLLIEIQSQYRRELANQRKLIQGKIKTEVPKLKTVVERKVYRKEVQKVKKQRIRAIKDIHKKRMTHLKKIKKKHTKSQLQRQLVKWKHQGYETDVLDSKYKLPKIEEVKKKIASWKAKGYDTSILEKKMK